MMEPEPVSQEFEKQKEFLCGARGLVLEQNLGGEPLLYYIPQDSRENRVLLGTALSMLSIKPSLIFDEIYSVVIGGRKLIFGDVMPNYDLSGREESSVVSSRTTYEELYIKLATDYAVAMQENALASKPKYLGRLRAKMRLWWLAKKPFKTYTEASQYITKESNALLQRSFDLMHSDAAKEIAERTMTVDRWGPWKPKEPTSELFDDGNSFSSLERRLSFVEKTATVLSKDYLMLDTKSVFTVMFIVTNDPERVKSNISESEQESQPAIIIYSPLVTTDVEQVITLDKPGDKPGDARFTSQTIQLEGNPQILINIKNTRLYGCFVSVDPQHHLLAANGEFGMQQFIENSRGELLVEALVKELADLQQKFLFVYFDNLKSKREKYAYFQEIFAAGSFLSMLGAGSFWIVYYELFNKPEPSLHNIFAVAMNVVVIGILEHRRQDAKNTEDSWSSLELEEDWKRAVHLLSLLQQAEEVARLQYRDVAQREKVALARRLSTPNAEPGNDTRQRLSQPNQLVSSDVAAGGDEATLEQEYD